MSRQTIHIAGFEVSIYRNGEARCANIYPFKPESFSDVSVTREDLYDYLTNTSRWEVKISWSSYGGMIVKEAARFSKAILLALVLVKWVDKGGDLDIGATEKELRQ